jgi:uncharacterized protein (TIGR01777 family)
MPARTVLVTGASGFIGRHLARACAARGVAMHGLTRNAARAGLLLGTAARVVERPGDIPPEVPVDAIVNLAGARIVGPPWTARRRQLLIDSRVRTTEAVLEWCRTRVSRPRVLVSASAIGFYGTAGDDWLDESSPPQPEQFQSSLCMACEAAASRGIDLGIRVVNLRFGLVLGADGGILPSLALPAKLGFASVIGDGRQWMSWIQVDDLVRIIGLAIDADDLDGAVNVVAPTPVRQREFQQALTRKLHRPLWLRTPAALLRLGLGEMSELLVQGQRVAPRRLAARGFEFVHPTLDTALDASLTRARS